MGNPTGTGELEGKAFAWRRRRVACGRSFEKELLLLLVVVSRWTAVSKTRITMQAGVCADLSRMESKRLRERERENVCEGEINTTRGMETRTKYRRGPPTGCRFDALGAGRIDAPFLPLKIPHKASTGASSTTWNHAASSSMVSGSKTWMISSKGGRMERDLIIKTRTTIRNKESTAFARIHTHFGDGGVVEARGFLLTKDRSSVRA